MKQNKDELIKEIKTPEYLRSFLEDLTELSKKHKIYIAGCGCCGSPYIINDIRDGLSIDELSFNEEEEKYNVNITYIHKDYRKGSHY